MSETTTITTGASAMKSWSSAALASRYLVSSRLVRHVAFHEETLRIVRLRDGLQRSFRGSVCEAHLLDAPW